MSSRDFRKKPSGADGIDVQLNDQVVQFLKNKRKGLRYDEYSNTLYLSKIFDWFEKDFGGRNGVIRFIKKHVPIPDTNPNIEFLDYNWNLNSQ